MSDFKVGGTLIWYYYICKREVWLMSHNITPNQEDENIVIGKFIDENSYERERKELSIGGSKIDVFALKNGQLLIGEIKKTSKYMQSAKMQLALYLYELSKCGIDACGELRFPKEKKREEVVLTTEIVAELESCIAEIEKIVNSEMPPPAQINNFCRNCAYMEFCLC